MAVSSDAAAVLLGGDEMNVENNEGVELLCATSGSHNGDVSYRVDNTREGTQESATLNGSNSHTMDPVDPVDVHAQAPSNFESSSPCNSTSACSFISQSTLSSQSPSKGD